MLYLRKNLSLTVNISNLYVTFIDCKSAYMVHTYICICTCVMKTVGLKNRCMSEGGESRQYKYKQSLMIYI